MAYFYCEKNEKPNTAKTSGSYNSRCQRGRCLFLWNFWDYISCLECYEGHCCFEVYNGYLGNNLLLLYSLYLRVIDSHYYA